MATAQELKNAKELGRLLQSARQREGMSLASLSKLTGISTARLVALEDGNFYFFINNGEEMNDVAVVYALASQLKSQSIFELTSHQLLPQKQMFSFLIF
jgi:transcriptional regulator with XRE-family HTH domain